MITDQDPPARPPAETSLDQMARVLVALLPAVREMADNMTTLAELLEHAVAAWGETVARLADVDADATEDEQ
jgi:hypothetical protein